MKPNRDLEELRLRILDKQISLLAVTYEELKKLDANEMYIQHIIVLCDDRYPGDLGHRILKNKTYFSADVIRAYCLEDRTQKKADYYVRRLRDRIYEGFGLTPPGAVKGEPLFPERTTWIKATKDGVDLEFCVYASENEGRALIAEVEWSGPNAGQPIPAPDLAFGYKTVEVKGKIEIQKTKADRPEVSESYPFGCGAEDEYDCP